MVQHSGSLIHTDQDEYGVIEVVDEGPTRTMYFGTEARQTTMFRRDPQALALSYTHCMMTSLLFTGPPRAALVLGLGGGALVRFLAHHFPDCRLETVEKRAKVAEVAGRFFSLPGEPPLRVHLGEAGAFLQAGQELWDLLLVDIHDPEGMALDVHQTDFFNHCRQRLASGGGMAINLWSGAREDALKRVMRQLRLAFDQRVLLLPVAGKHNCIGLGLASELEPGQMPALRQRAADLEKRLKIPLSGQLEDLVRFNPHAF